MSWILVAWSMMGGVCVALAAIHIVVWQKRPAESAHLLFAIAAIAIAVLAVFEMFAMKAASVEQLGMLQRWAAIPVAVLMLAIMAFVRVFFGTGRLWLAYSVCALRLLMLIVNFSSDVNFHVLEIVSLRQIDLFWGEAIVAPVDVPNPWNLLDVFSILLYLVYVLDAALALWRQGGATQRRRALRIGGGITLATLVAGGEATLVNQGMLHLPYIITPSCLLFLAAMSWELGSEVFRAAELARDLKLRDAQLRDSAMQMELAASAAGLGMWEWDIERDEFWMTDATRGLFGFRPGERINLRGFLEKVHSEDRENLRRSVIESPGEVGSVHTEFRMLLAHGRERWISAQGSAHSDGQGRPTLVRGVSLDVTRRKQAEDRFRLVVEASPNAMAIVSKDGALMLVNAQMEATFGYSRAELARLRLDDLIPERMRGGLAVLRQLYASQPAPRAAKQAKELYGRRKDGSEFPIEIGLALIDTREDDLMLATIADISERRRAEIESADQRNELTHLSRVALLGELSGSLAHELNQPLAAILSNAQAAQRFLERDAGNIDEVREILADIVADDKRAGEVIRRLRALLKKEEFVHRPVDVNEVVGEVLRMIRSDLLNRNVTVKNDLATDLPMARGDIVHLQQVLLNLFMNACDAMAALAPPDRLLSVSTRLTNDGVIEVCVADQGWGIPPDQLEKVFEPFMTTKAHGMGLGLLVCRTIVQSHGGKLWAVNNAKRGATFHFTLSTYGESHT